MGTSKLMRKLEEFFDLSRSKQIKKRDKLDEFIARLDEKKAKLEAEMVTESETDETSEAHQELEKKHKAVSKLLKRARQSHHDLTEEE
jgi:hypothetical protein